MSVQKYRDVSEMPPPPRATPKELGSRIRALWNRSAGLAKLGYPAGVYRFATIDDAQAARAQNTKKRATALRASRNLRGS